MGCGRGGWDELSQRYLCCATTSCGTNVPRSMVRAQDGLWARAACSGSQNTAGTAQRVKGWCRERKAGSCAMALPAGGDRRTRHQAGGTDLAPHLAQGTVSVPLEEPRDRWKTHGHSTLLPPPQKAQVFGPGKSPAGGDEQRELLGSPWGAPGGTPGEPQPGRVHPKLRGR